MKQSLHILKRMSLILLGLFSTLAMGQTVENFEYTSGELLTANGYGTKGDAPAVYVTDSGLEYSGLAVSVKIAIGAVRADMSVGRRVCFRRRSLIVKSFFSVSSLGRAQRDSDDHIRGSSHDGLAIASSHPRNCKGVRCPKHNM